MGNSHCTFIYVVNAISHGYLLLWRGCLVGVEIPLDIPWEVPAVCIYDMTIFHEISRGTLHGISAIHYSRGISRGVFHGLSATPVSRETSH